MSDNIESTVLEVSDFDRDVINSDVPVLLDMSASWCGPCKMMSMLIKDVAKANPLIKVFELDIENNPEIVERYSVSSVPTLLFVKGGEVKKKTSGFRSMSDIQKDINEVLI